MNIAEGIEFAQHKNTNDSIRSTSIRNPDGQAQEDLILTN